MRRVKTIVRQRRRERRAAQTVDKTLVREGREGQTPLVDRVVWSPRPSTGGKRPRAGPEASQGPGEDLDSQDIFNKDTPGQDIYNKDAPGQDIFNKDIPRQDIFTMDTPKLPAQRKSRRVDK